MQFVADENVSRQIIERLRRAGHDVVSIQEVLSGISDQEVLKVAESQGRILITGDRDFGELSVRHRIGTSGVILLQIEHLSLAARADRVAEVIDANIDRLAGNFIVIEPARIRIRPLVFE